MHHHFVHYCERLTASHKHPSVSNLPVEIWKWTDHLRYPHFVSPPLRAHPLLAPCVLLCVGMCKKCRFDCKIQYTFRPNKIINLNVFKGAELFISVHINVLKQSIVTAFRGNRNHQTTDSWSALIISQKGSNPIDTNWFVTTQPFTRRGKCSYITKRRSSEKNQDELCKSCKVCKYWELNLYAFVLGVFLSKEC